jgi:uncharacterized protein
VNMRPILENKSTPQDIDESTDAYDTIDWLVKNVPNNNGRVGMMGISYPGFYSACGMIDSHPALKCVSPQAPIADWFIGDDIHHNGAFFLTDTFTFDSFFGQKLEDPLHESAKPFDFRTRDSYEFFLNMGPVANADKKYFKGKIDFWNEALSHPNYDEFWQARNLRPHLKRVHAAVMTVGGWFDASTPVSKTCSSWVPGRTANGLPRTATAWATSNSIPKRLSIIATISSCRS